MMKNIYIYLAYAGLAPFIFCALCLVAGVEVLPLMGETKGVLSSYSLVILSFMVGSYWGQYLKLDDKQKLFFPIFSNVNAVVMWMVYLTIPFKPMIFLFLLNFLLLLLIDKKLFDGGAIDPEYYRMRVQVTIGVVVTLFVSFSFA
jgi:hypothetical protein